MPLSSLPATHSLGYVVERADWYPPTRPEPRPEPRPEARKAAAMTVSPAIWTVTVIVIVALMILRALVSLTR